MPSGIYLHKKQDLAQRFWKRVDMSGGPDACWPWQGYRMPEGRGTKRRLGRGQIRVGNKATLTNRLAYELTFRPLAPGENACHSCDNPVCCNPRHLFAGSQLQNMQDAVRKGRTNKESKYRKITLDKYECFISLRQDGLTYAEIGNHFNISGNQARLIIRKAVVNA